MLHVADHFFNLQQFLVPFCNLFDSAALGGRTTRSTQTDFSCERSAIYQWHTFTRNYSGTLTIFKVNVNLPISVAARSKM